MKDKRIDKIIKIDPLLEKHKDDLSLRMQRFDTEYNRLCLRDGSFNNVYNKFEYFGFNKTTDGVTFREWLPGADEVFLIGDFNNWDKTSLPLHRLDSGVWEILLDTKSVRNGDYCKLWIRKDSEYFERIPAYILSTARDEKLNMLCGRVYLRDGDFKWTDERFYKKKKITNPLIYEAHIGMSQDKEGVGSYLEFADNTLQRIKNLGYNVIQLMAIQEHPYYASFGYQVTNFYSPSFRYGSIDELKYLINKAHSMGIAVLLDVVHSHSCPNMVESLNYQDGSDSCYFKQGRNGWHPAWGTRLFDYEKDEVIEFLLSNLTYWQEEFHFDGFRFDGVTSMIFTHHGLEHSFSGYSDYFNLTTDISAINYLQLANMVVHNNNEKAITICEDMSGTPGMCLPIDSCGVGFDFRLSMGVPDYWIKLLKEYKFENWDMFKLWYELTTSRPKEGSISYVESHDQALVGDKTIIFRLLDSEMYRGMEKSYHSLTMDIGIDMHKLIRFITLTLAKSGYLNFMGNEFGHPEWVDFPREGNGWSYKYARRQWNLVDNGLLKYEWLNNFDNGMIELVKKEGILKKQDTKNLWIDQNKKIFSFTRSGCVFVFNFGVNNVEKDFFIPAKEGKYKVIFDSDKEEFGGQGRVDTCYEYVVKNDSRGFGFSIYLPPRVAIVLKRMEG